MEKAKPKTVEELQAEVANLKKAKEEREARAKLEAELTALKKEERTANMPASQKKARAILGKLLNVGIAVGKEGLKAAAMQNEAEEREGKKRKKKGS